jgi:hypothetical protein
VFRLISSHRIQGGEDVLVYPVFESWIEKKREGNRL